MDNVIVGYFRRGGLAILSSGFLVKGISLALSIFLARMISKENYGNVVYALLVVNLLRPIASSGFANTFLRYGSICKSEEEKDGLLAQLFKLGLFSSLVMTGLLLLLSWSVCSNKPDSLVYFWILTGSVVTDYLLQMLGAYFRIRSKSRSFAVMNVMRSVALACVAVAFVFLYGAYGYAVALVVAPLVAFLLMGGFRSMVSSRGASVVRTTHPGMGKFWAFASVSAMISNGAFLIDGVIVGNMLSDPELLAQYRVAGLLPINLMIIPSMFFTSEYLHIAKNHESRSFVIKYLKEYMMIATALSLSVLLVSELLGEWLITLIFSEKYVDSAPLFKILIYGLCGAFILRQPFGVLINASGRSDLNLLSAVTTIIITVARLFYLIQSWGLYGAAIGTALAMWFTGLVGMALYFTQVFPKLKKT